MPILTLSLSDVDAGQPSLLNVWSVMTKVKENVHDGRRLENLSWRLFSRVQPVASRLSVVSAASAGSTISTILALQSSMAALPPLPPRRPAPRPEITVAATVTTTTSTVTSSSTPLLEPLPLRPRVSFFFDETSNHSGSESSASDGGSKPSSPGSGPVLVPVSLPVVSSKGIESQTTPVEASPLSNLKPVLVASSAHVVNPSNNLNSNSQVTSIPVEAGTRHSIQRQLEQPLQRRLQLQLLEQHARMHQLQHLQPLPLDQGAPQLPQAKEQPIMTNSELQFRLLRQQQVQQQQHQLFLAQKRLQLEKLQRQGQTQYGTESEYSDSDSEMSDDDEDFNTTSECKNGNNWTAQFSSPQSRPGLDRFLNATDPLFRKVAPEPCRIQQSLLSIKLAQKGELPPPCIQSFDQPAFDCSRSTSCAGFSCPPSLLAPTPNSKDRKITRSPPKRIPHSKSPIGTPKVLTDLKSRMISKERNSARFIPPQRKLEWGEGVPQSVSVSGF